MQDIEHPVVELTNTIIHVSDQRQEHDSAADDRCDDARALATRARRAHLLLAGVDAAAHTARTLRALEAEGAQLHRGCVSADAAFAVRTLENLVRNGGRSPVARFDDQVLTGGTRRADGAFAARRHAVAVGIEAILAFDARRHTRGGSIASRRTWLARVAFVLACSDTSGRASNAGVTCVTVEEAGITYLALQFARRRVLLQLPVCAIERRIDDTTHHAVQPEAAGVEIVLECVDAVLPMLELTCIMREVEARLVAESALTVLRIRRTRCMCRATV